MDFTTYDSYFKWNEALIKHYLSSKNDIVLLVDEAELDVIGNKYKIIKSEDESFENNFCSTILSFSTGIKEGQTDILKIANAFLGDDTAGTFKVSYKFTETDNGIDSFKNGETQIKYNKTFVLTQSDQGKINCVKKDDATPAIYDLPAFAFAIYIILKFDDGESQQWENVKKAIKEELQTSKNVILSGNVIKILWKKIHDYNEHFDDYASVYEHDQRKYEDYVGRIKYHLPLAAPVRRKIHDAIYKTGAWKMFESRSFSEIVSRIVSSIKDQEAKNEINYILHKQFSTNDQTGVSLRKLQSVVEDFDIDVYEENLAQRQNTPEYGTTKIYGDFALAIYFPEDIDEVQNSIVLLTTIQQKITHGGYMIETGESGSLAEYNTSFVKYQGSYDVKIEEHIIDTQDCQIKSMRLDEVVFFYEYDQTLYIQTRQIVPANSYIIVVKKGQEENFEKWCQNVNDIKRLQNTEGLYGTDWSVFYAPNGLQGQYYDEAIEDESVAESAETIVSKGGIKNKYGQYFVTALPYFEIPKTKDVSRFTKDNIYINIDGTLLDDYNLIISGQKLIIDIPQVSIPSDDFSTCDIALFDGNVKLAEAHFDITGQNIEYEEDYLYRFDRYGVKVNSDGEYAYYGNSVDPSLKADHLLTSYPIILPELDKDYIPESLYCVNLLAACCYDSSTGEISHDKFRKCINYAATRLNVDTEKEGFVRNAKYTLAQAGIINIDFETNKCQAIPPSFAKVPLSITGVGKDQRYILTGCYTRAFISNLQDYCKNNTKIKLYEKVNEVGNTSYAKLLPSVILISSNFDPKDFLKRYNHKCDIISEEDFCSSLLNVIPSWHGMEFDFYQTTEQDLHLQPAKETSLPRLRKDSNSHNIHWYLETTGQRFAEVQKSKISWTSMYCFLQRQSPMIIKNTDAVYLPAIMQLPTYIQRSLYIMNLGKPQFVKAFICNNPSNNGFYSLMHYYNLQKTERINLLVKRLVGNDVNGLVRCAYNPNNNEKLRMELWISNSKSSKESQKYLILSETDGSILAIALGRDVYLKNQTVFRKILNVSLNTAMSFLIQEPWQFGDNYSSIGLSPDKGKSYKGEYKLGTEFIELPDKSLFKTEEITIL